MQGLILKYNEMKHDLLKEGLDSSDEEVIKKARWVLTQDFKEEERGLMLELQEEQEELTERYERLAVQYGL